MPSTESHTDDYGLHNSITPDTLNHLLNEKEKGRPLPKVMIIDCRYDYEFKGGHIKGALNLNSQEEIQNLFLASKEIVRANTQQRTLVIFHCEFSQRRGPKMYSVLRGLDRQLNTEVYPKLFYPEIYILEGGYSKFTKLYPEHCVGGYIQQDFERDQRAKMNRVEQMLREISDDYKSRQGQCAAPNEI